jgi:hypothetical protein
MTSSSLLFSSSSLFLKIIGILLTIRGLTVFTGFLLLLLRKIRRNEANKNEKQ